MSSNRRRTASTARTDGTEGPTRPRRTAPAAKPAPAGRGRAAAPARMPERLRDLSADQRRAAEAYLAELQQHMSLRHWDLAIDWDEMCADDCDAQVSTVDGRYTAVLWLHDRFFTLPLAEQRRVLVHELLHMHTSGVITAARLGIKNLTKDTRSWVMGYVRDAEEHAVDALSQVVGGHLPLPAWAEPVSPQGRFTAL